MNSDKKAAKILVVGIGGAGNNAVNRMIDEGIHSAEFIAVNTDIQDLSTSKAPTKLQIGEKLTNGLGAGANPEQGEKAALESIEAIKDMLKDVDLLFITAGMGGGTGTGAAPIVATEARKMNILTIAVVTKPFNFEGPRRMQNAENGITKLREQVDTLLIVPNEKILRFVPKGTTIINAFKKADEVLKTGIQGISDLISKPTLINLDFNDVKAIVKDKGMAHMGVGEVEGENRIIEAVRDAVSSPLLETSIEGATGVILNVTGGPELAIDEVGEACELIREVVDPSANIIFGADVDENLGKKVRVTVIATGFIPRANSNIDISDIANTARNKIESQMASRNYDASQPMRDSQSTQEKQPVFGRNDFNGFNQQHDNRPLDRQSQQNQAQNSYSNLFDRSQASVQNGNYNGYNGYNAPTRPTFNQPQGGQQPYYQNQPQSEMQQQDITNNIPSGNMDTTEKKIPGYIKRMLRKNK